jgi:hypothetical protein
MNAWLNECICVISHPTYQTHLPYQPLFRRTGAVPG